MGKRKHPKPKARRLAAQKKTVRPDDYLCIGPFEMARFDKVGIIRNRLTREQFEIMQDRLAEHFPEVRQDIDQKILEAVEIIVQHSPVELLKRGYWEIVGEQLRALKDKTVDKDDPLPLRMVDYVQSIIVSVPPLDVPKRDIDEAQWQKLKELVSSIFTRLNIEYQSCRSALDRKHDPEYEIVYDEYCVRAQLLWCNVRGRRYLVHDIPYLRDVLSPHDEVLKELFGVSVTDLLGSFGSIIESLSKGVLKAVEDLREFQDVTTAKLADRATKMEQVDKNDLPRIMQDIIEDNKWEGWRDDIFGRFFGTDLFNVQKVTTIPESLLEELSWEAGQDKEFFGAGEYRGWPLRVWSTSKRPFIKVDGDYYCFELFSLFDNIYRILQRIITEKKPEYIPTWNKKQKMVSEDIPIRLFQKLLPGAQVFQSVHYRWHTGSNRNLQWCETDALIIYEDHLFVLEVKAGAFTYTAPATDFPAYIESLRNLVLKPAEQGRRFLEYINSDNEVAIFNLDHIEIGRIRRSAFEHVTICAVTLDPFTDLAAQVQHLKGIGIDVGQEPVWSISMDDLRVYADIFDNPLVFLHFVEERMRAFRSSLIQTDDEMDHLGLYLTHNIYTEYVKEFSSGLDKPISWNGYREKIDGFFDDKFRDPALPCPLKQEMPTRLAEIVDFLAFCNKPGRRKVVSLLLNYGGSWRNNIASSIDDVLKVQSSSLRPRPVSTYGGTNITMFCWQHGVIERDRKLAFDHASASMLVTQEDRRMLLELVFNGTGSLVEVDFSFLTLLGIPPWDMDRLKRMADTLRRQRIDEAKQKGKLSPNQQCPCGSGRKYKKCCKLIGL